MDKEKPFQHQKQQKLEQTYNNGFEIGQDSPVYGRFFMVPVVASLNLLH